MEYEDWLQFRRAETPAPTPQKLPCAYCDQLTAEAQSVPGTYGDITCEGETLTVCLGCGPMLQSARALAG